MRDFLLMMGVQYLYFTVLVINIRAIATANYMGAVLTDVAASAILFFLVRQIGDAKSYMALLGMMTGGGLASWSGIWLTRHWK